MYRVTFCVMKYSLRKGTSGYAIPNFKNLVVGEVRGVFTSY